jgi:predicted transcriptional regulator of viral defense system
MRVDKHAPDTYVLRTYVSGARLRLVMYLWEAASKVLAKADLPLITEYSFYVMMRPIVEASSLDGVPISRATPTWDRAKCRTLINDLQRRRFLVPDIDFSKGVWRFTQTSRSSSAEEACCLVDPFAYISHLSAMQLYGLSNRSPTALHMTTACRPVWTTLRAERMKNDRGTQFVDMPPLKKISYKAEVRKRWVISHETVHPATPVGEAGGFARVAPLGRVFADMLSEPHLCGGIRHVIEIWEENAEQYLDEIIEAVDQHPTKLAKVRAGYLLSEHMEISEPRIDAWETFAQRGGSQKLDPEAPYETRWSERWKISLNV